jgi:hypothetical protein
VKVENPGIKLPAAFIEMFRTDLAIAWTVYYKSREGVFQGDIAFETS